MKLIKKFSNTSQLALLLSLVAMDTHAALYDRGNGMIYDSTLKITWLQDANYAQTSGYAAANTGGSGSNTINADGSMGWDAASNWANNLVYDGYGGWHLASAKLIGNSFFSYDGGTDVGYNITRSQIGHLFSQLGNVPAYNIGGYGLSGYGFFHTTFVDASGTYANDGFLNVRRDGYWEKEEASYQSNYAWSFYGYDGDQSKSFNKGFAFFAWAVRNGDVAAVPLPAAAWLFGSGLVGLIGNARRRSAA